jgi:hypothetical protein
LANEKRLVKKSQLNLVKKPLRKTFNAKSTPMRNVAMMRTFRNLLALVIIAALSITLISSVVVAQDTDDSDLEADLQILFYKENSSYPIGYFGSNYPPDDNVIYTDNGNGTIFVRLRMSQVYSRSAQDTIMTGGNSLTYLSYSASWLNQTAVVPSGESFTLTNIPYGNHVLTVNASSVYKILDSWVGPTFHPLHRSALNGLNFTVASVSTPTPLATPLMLIQSSSLELTIVIVAAVIAVIFGALVFYRRHHKSGTIEGQ